MRKFMKQTPGPLDNQNGSIILIAMVTLLLLTVLGITSITNTSIELKIAGNDKLHKIAFNNADSGVYGTPKLISETVNENEQFTGTMGFTYVTRADSSDFHNQVLGYDTYDGGSPDVAFAFDSQNGAQIDVERVRSVNVAGGGAEFAAGSEGLGVGSVGGVAVYYAMNSQGTAPNSAASTVVADYRKVVGVAGGL